jgi:hypothetical protein
LDPGPGCRDSLLPARQWLRRGIARARRAGWSCSAHLSHSSRAFVPIDHACFHHEENTPKRRRVPAGVTVHGDQIRGIAHGHPANLSLQPERTGCPVTINTSFNIRGEPIVCTPENAYRYFMGADLDVLVVENCFMTKARQPEALRLDYRREVDLD